MSEFRASIAPRDMQPCKAWWFIFSGYSLLVETAGETRTVPAAEHSEELGISINPPLHIGTLGEVPCYAASVTVEADAHAGYCFEQLRSLFDHLQDSFYEAALTAVHLVEWDRNCRFCGRCGGDMKWRTDVRAKECEKCGRMEFPRLSPAVIVLIEKGDTLLLARSARFAGEFYSILAGFVEPGESLEAAVRREVFEETGITVKDIHYFGSQPWPFPDSLMIGFTARYESGEIRIDGEEIIDAGWYRADNLPRIPGKLSIARQLIDWFIAKQVKS